MSEPIPDTDTKRQNIPLMAPEEEVLTTLDAEGHRKWMYPRIERSGRFLKRRRIVGWALIILFVVLPWLRMPNGQEVFLFNLLERRFVFFGMVFLKSDLPLLALLLVIIFAGIFFITAALGRLWCGWACPQTVYMEFVFRPLERWATGRTGIGGRPSGKAPGYRRIVQFVLYLLICFVLSNVFLSYFVGTDTLFGMNGGAGWMTNAPWKHPGGFFMVLLVTAMMFFDFAFWREQMCTLACPYGRMQSALLDEHSLIVTYDASRGEPRGKPKKAKKGTTLSLPQLGDCIDCNMCVTACPTGIDIRDGLQLECIHCTACMDACDTIMDKFQRDRGLIRYASQAGMAGRKTRWIRPRMVVYPLFLALAGSLLMWLTLERVGFSMHTTAAKGAMRYHIMENGQIQNRLTLNIINRTTRTQTYQLTVPENALYHIGEECDSLTVHPGEEGHLTLRLETDPAFFTHSRRPAIIIATEDESGRSRETRHLISGPQTN